MIEQLITDHLDLWSSAVRPKSSAGRGSNSKLELTGIKKLRELILELAVRGKLVPQDPNDEPASVLLERIAAEKARLVKEGKIKKPKPLPEITDDEKPFEIPVGWSWARLDDIGRDWGQVTPQDKFSYIDVGSINKELGFIADIKILTAGEAPSRARKIVKKGTVIYSTVRPYLLNIAVVDRDFSPEAIASTAFAIIHPLCEIVSSYIYHYLRSPCFVQYVESCQTGIAYPAINDKQFFSGVIPVAPANEQVRIVAKVDELMSLCDQLEQKSEASLAAHQTLVETLLATLTESADSSELAKNWARLAQHFDSLFTTQSSIDALKQTILQLAVMGKLVPQDPDDEPASVLLERIATEKARLVKEGKIKKEKHLPPISEEEKPFALPDGWEWCYVGMIADVKGGYAFKSGDFIVAGNAQVIRMGNVKPDELRLNENPVFISNALADASCGFELFKSDILLTMTGTKGKRDYLYSLVLEQDDFQGKSLYINQRLCCFRPFIVDSGYINFVIKDARLMDSMYKKSTGTANQANIGMDALLKWVIPMEGANKSLANSTSKCDTRLCRLTVLFEYLDRLP
ncbi:hypothetical protein, partial [Aeromonas caviae]